MGDLARLEAVVARIEVALDTLDAQGSAAVSRIERALEGLALPSLSLNAAGGGTGVDPAPNRRADTLFEDAALGDEIEAACASHESELLSAGLGHVTSFGETHAVTRLSANTATSGMVEEQTEVLQAYDELSAGAINAYFEASVAVGGPVAEQAELVRRAYVALRRLIKIAPHTREPGPKILKQLLEAIDAAIKAVKSFAAQNLQDEYALHLLGVADGILALAWVSTGLQWRTDLKTTPVEWVQRFIDTTEREYFEGIYDEHKGEDNIHTVWARSFITMLKELLAYVTKWHPENLAWGNKMRSMTFWSNALAQTAPGDTPADAYEFNTKLGIPIAQHSKSKVDPPPKRFGE